MKTMDRQKLLEQIDLRQEELYDLLCKLIRINSENFGSHGNERECPNRIAEICREMGLETTVYSPMELEGFTGQPDYMEGRHLEDRFNVTAVWKGETDTNGLMLMGHHDTVVIGDRSLWSFEPLIGEIRDGKIWGRGACDDKYAIATALFLIRVLKDLGFQPKENLLMTAYCDEEVGGSHGALASVLQYPAKRLVNMDCKNFEIWQAASGGACCKYRFHVNDPLYCIIILFQIDEINAVILAGWPDVLCLMLLELYCLFFRTYWKNRATFHSFHRPKGRSTSGRNGQKQCSRNVFTEFPHFHLSHPF